MTQRLLVELLWFLLPFAVFLIYRAASKDLRVRDRWPVLRLTLIGAGLAAIALIIPPLLAPSNNGKCYEAPRYDSKTGVTTPGQYVDCDKANAPVIAAPPPTAPPVAPRDDKAPRDGGN